jgi:hypothetical protein
MVADFHQKEILMMQIETASSIIKLLDEDEEVGVIVFDEIVDIVQEMRLKRDIDYAELNARLQSIEPRGDMNIGPGMTTGISMLQSDTNVERNKRIIFITDASPTIGEAAPMIQDETEQVFKNSKGMIGVTYIGIGLSFDASVCSELGQAHSTTVVNISNSRELEEMMRTKFNY